MNFRTIQVGEVATFKYGSMLKGGSFSTQGDYPIYSGYGITGYTDQYNIDQPTLVVIARGNSAGKVKISPPRCWLTNLSIAVELIDASVSKEYLYYFFSGPRNLAYLNTGSAQPQITISDLSQLRISLPDINTQKKIAKILSGIDSKIANNERMNDNLYKIGQTLYHEKFAKHTQAKMRNLGSFFPVVTGKKDANAATKNGNYPFFTCSRQVSAIDEYSFDGSAILLAGNGDFNVKFYRGKFDAYQRTYVLIPEDESLLGYLYWAISLNLKNITSDFRGSVIKFITKGNIEDFEIPFVDDPATFRLLQECLEKIESNERENLRLATLRDTLLPELINGKINLSKYEF